MKLRQIFLATAAIMSTSALAIDMQAATNTLATEARLVDVSTLSAEEAPVFISAMLGELNNAEAPKELVLELFRNNPQQANVVYAVAKKSGMEDDFLVAAALSAGVDPSVMLQPTAISLALPPPPPPPPPGGGGGTTPPPPPPDTGGGSGGGGISVSEN
jgi:hypothetical protein